MKEKIIANKRPYIYTERGQLMCEEVPLSAEQYVHIYTYNRERILALDKGRESSLTLVVLKEIGK